MTIDGIFFVSYGSFVVEVGLISVVFKQKLPGGSAIKCSSASFGASAAASYVKWSSRMYVHGCAHYQYIYIYYIYIYL